MVIYTISFAQLTLGGFFVFAAKLNVNDPDWMLWSTAYGIGAIICIWTVVENFSATKKASSASRFWAEAQRTVAMAYGAACLGLAVYSAFLAPRPSDTDQVVDSYSKAEKSAVLKFLSSETTREAGGALIMVQAMILCYISRLSEKRAEANTSARGQSTAMSILSVGIAGVAISLGIYLPEYLQRQGIAVPAHCGGSEEDSGS